jgi:nucleotide-binding universal stress UspA family protein
VPIPLNDGTFQPLPIDIDKMEESQKREVNKVCATIQSYRYEDSNPIECEPIVALSYPGSEVLNEAKEYDVDLIVLSSRFVPALQRWFGTISSQVAEHTDKPVLIIPEGAEYSNFKKIVFATDLNEDYTKVLEVIKFANYFNSQVTVLFISDPDNDEEDKLRYENYKEKISHPGNYELLQFETVSSKDKVSSLRNYVTNKKVDLLIMIKHQYHFLGRLFHKSVSNEVVFHSEFPVLILH